MLTEYCASQRSGSEYRAFVYPTRSRGFSFGGVTDYAALHLHYLQSYLPEMLFAKVRTETYFAYNSLVRPLADTTY